MSSVDLSLRFERFSPLDAEANARLSQSVGWQDVESEWRVLHDAAEVWGARMDGRVVAQGALADYGNSASLAKMVVAPDLQRRGYGARLLDDLLAKADARQLSVGLCATELGRPLYATRGFKVSGELVILTGTPALGTATRGPVVPLLDAELPITLDRRFSSCDRSRMLRARFREASCALGFDSAGQGCGLASVQGPGTLVGPILAETEPGARALAAGLFAAAGGPVRIDVPLEHVGFRGWLRNLGLVEQAVRVEMARGAVRLPWQVPQRFALAAQAWG